MPRTRRAFLRASGVALLTGCVGRSPGSAGAESPQTGTSTSTLTPQSTPYSNRTVAFPEGPKTRPDRPDDLTRESVRRFVRTHEYRYVYNTLWMNEHTDMSLDCTVQTVEPVGDGYRARVECTGSSTTGGYPLPNSTRTATPVHADYFTRTYVYYVDENSILRYDPDAPRTSTP